MTARKWIGIFGIVLCGTGSLLPAQVSAASKEEAASHIKLDTAGDVVNVCTVDSGNEHYEAALAFCYGFFEGATRYHQAISGSGVNRGLVCAPAGTTRQQAVDVFITYIEENPQYSSEDSIDSVFRALMVEWPCN